MREKGFAPLVVVMIIAFAVGGLLFYKNYSRSPEPGVSDKTVPQRQVSESPSLPTPTSTGETTDDPGRKGWKIFKNRLPGYQVSYPGNWVKGERFNYANSVGDLVLLSSKDGGKRDGLGFLKGEMQMNFGCLRFGDGTSIKYAQDLMKVFQPGSVTYPEDKTGGVLTRLELSEINSRQTVKLLYENSYEGSVYANLYRVKGDSGIAVCMVDFFAADKESLGSYSQQIDEILHSLKIPQSSVSEEVGFKTYQNDKLGLNFQYPASWIEYEDQVKDFNGTNTVIHIKDDSGKHAHDAGTDDRVEFILEPNSVSSCTVRDYINDLEKAAAAQDVVNVGGQEINLKEFCFGKYSFQFAGGRKVSVWLFLAGDLADNKSKEILKSVGGIKVFKKS